MTFWKTVFAALLVVFLPAQLMAGAAVDVTKSVKVSVPDKWTSEKPSGIHQLMLTCPETEANILMLSQQVGDASLTQCEKAWVQSVSKNGNYKILSRQNKQLAGLPGKALTFTTSIKSDNSTTKLTYVQLLTVRNKLLYAFQFVCKETDYKSCMPAFNSVLASLKWLK